jgi:predicted AAA+ superfamily ATPase
MVPRLLAGVLAHGTKSALVVGPRQTGKSTLFASLAPDLNIDLANESTYRDFVSRPEELEARIAAVHPASVFIDEVQRIPSLLNTVQSLIDRTKRRGERTTRFWLTGSSARKLRRGQANLLPGRLFTYGLGPLCAAELEYKVDTHLALSVGTLPEPYLEHPTGDKHKLLRSYAGSYLREEIQAEALTRNLESFSRFLDVAAQSASQSLDFSKLATRASVSRRSAMRYFEILEDTLIARRVDPVPDLDADVVRHPKLYFFDPGVLNGLLGNFTASPDRLGMLFEHLFVSQVWASAAARDKDVRVSTFRTRGGLEIDFVIDLDGARWLVETKASSRTHASDASALVRAADTYFAKKARRLVVHSGETARVYDDVPHLPWQAALREMSL